jgi:uncharacterized protein (TIGR03503 family)
LKKNLSRLSGVSRRNRKLLRSLTWFWAALLCIFFINAVKAQTGSEASELPRNDATALSVVEKILPIGNKYQNTITLLNNRFRIDDGVDQVVLVFFREFGAPPVVLVRPDGGKLFLDNDAKDDSFRWYESDNYDMIELSKPTPGPWQALGQILPNSRVMVIADLKLEAQAIPSPVFSGETIKLTAFLINAGEKVNFKEIREGVSLSIDFMSTNHPDYENFGLGTKNIARFEDNGRGLDESGGDGTFTGKFDLDISNGEWLPVFSVRTPLFSREQTGETLMLLPNPITLSHVEDDNEAGFHTIRVAADPQYIATNSLLVEGTIRSPEGEIERFSLTEVGPQAREITVIDSGYGLYRTKISAYMQALDGRDIVLDVPEFTFVTKAAIVEVPEQASAISTEASQVDAAPDELTQAEPQSNLIAIALGVNFALLCVGGLIIFLLADKRKQPDARFLRALGLKFKHFRVKKTEQAEQASR